MLGRRVVWGGVSQLRVNREDHRGLGGRRVRRSLESAAWPLAWWRPYAKRGRAARRGVTRREGGAHVSHKGISLGAGREKGIGRRQRKACSLYSVRVIYAKRGRRGRDDTRVSVTASAPSESRGDVCSAAELYK